MDSRLHKVPHAEFQLGKFPPPITHVRISHSRWTGVRSANVGRSPKNSPQRDHANIPEALTLLKEIEDGAVFPIVDSGANLCKTVCILQSAEAFRLIGCCLRAFEKKAWHSEDLREQLRAEIKMTRERAKELQKFCPAVIFTEKDIFSKVRTLQSTVQTGLCMGR